MKKILIAIFLLMFVLSIFGCSSYRAYLGLHGKSIRLYPDVHELSFVKDKTCLECHHPDRAQAPPTSHPDFRGCLKCHNDEIESSKD